MKLFSGVMILLFSASAHAFCFQPTMYETEPSPPLSFSKPSVPFCFSGYEFSGTHTCESWELQNYFDELEAYVDELRDYSERAWAFADAASIFASEVTDYANCEIEAVSP